MIEGDERGRCFICRRYTATEVHHMLHGTRRKAADQYGLTVNLCHMCHMKLHDRGEYDRELQELAQAEFEKTHTHAEWMEIFGKNYRR